MDEARLALLPAHDVDHLVGNRFAGRADFESVADLARRVRMGVGELARAEFLWRTKLGPWLDGMRGAHGTP